MSENTQGTEVPALADPVIAIVRVERDDLDHIKEFHFTDIDIAGTFIESHQHIPEARRVELFKFAGAWDREIDGRAPTIVTPDDDLPRTSTGPHRTVVGQDAPRGG